MKIMRLHREKEPDFKTIKRLEIQKPEQFVSKSGFPIYLLPIQDQEIVKIDFVFDAGEFSAKSSLTSLATLAMLQEGSTSQNAEEIAERLDFLGSYLSCSATKDMATVTVCCLEKYLTETAKIVTEFILNPIFPEDKFATYLLKREEHYKIDIERVEVLSQKKLAQVLFGKDNPYGRSLQQDDFTNITRNDLEMFHKQNYIAQKCKIIICGNPKSQELQSLINYLKEFQINSSNKLIQPTDFNPNSDEKHTHYIHKENAVQASLNIGKIMVNRNHNDFIPLQVLNTVLGGYFGSRLMSNIREDKGYTYGIGSGIISYEKSGYFIITTRVGKEVVQPALDAIYQEIKRLRTEMIPQEELEMVKTYMLSTLVRNFDGAFATSEMLKNTFNYNIEYNDYYQRYWNKVSKIQPKELQELANVYFNEDSMYEVVVG